MRTAPALLLLLLAACGDAGPPAVAVGPVTYAEDELLGLSEARRATLGRLAALGLAVSDSSTAELGAPLTARWEEDALLDILAAELTLDEHGVGDDVLEARYLTDPDHELTVRHILFFSERWRTPGERAEARAKAERALERVRAGADFAAAAAELSEEPGAQGRQGLLTPGREGSWVDEFWAAAAALEPGEIGPVTETRYGFHVLRLEGRAVVPFAQARPRVAREVADRIEDPRALLGAWLDARGAGLSLDEGFVEGGDPVAEGATLATWDDGALTAEDLSAWVASQPASWKRSALDAGADARRVALTELARRRMALDEAERRGLVVPAGERAEVARRWDDLVYRWSASLGLGNGLAPDAVARVALDALASTAQGAVIARAEVDERAPLLEARYEILVATPGG